VSVIPFPQTQLRVMRPKRARPEGSTLAGCLAWYPCVKFDSTFQGEEPFSKPKVVYTWDKYLAIRQVSEVQKDEDDGKEGPPNLKFDLVNEWMGEEPIVAVQWLLQQVVVCDLELTKVLVLLTVSQRLLILDTSTMQVTATSDLLMRQILHHDRFSNHMTNFPAVADAYYSSFKTYKNKLFLLVYMCLCNAHSSLSIMFQLDHY
jgi:vacuolar protein sorting-associated protein 8